MISRLSRNLQSKLSKASQLWRIGDRGQRLLAVVNAGRPLILISAIATGLVFASRELDLLEIPEMAAYDHLIRLRPATAPDPRILIVTITEADIQAQQQWPLSDATITRLLTQLEQHQPRAIGLDIYRDIAQPPGREALIQHLKNSDRTVAICKLGDAAEDVGVAPPPGMPENRLGFSDFVVDEDGIVRRSLLLAKPEATSSCATRSSFGFQLARLYLAQEGIKPTFNSDGVLQMGSATFPRLRSETGGYEGVDDRGYQIMMNYRASENVARQVTLQQVLDGKIDPNWVRDRVVVVGVTAPSIDDAFYTPYSANQRQTHKMPGVVIHAQSVSQILSTVLDQRALFWDWPEWSEMLWIWVWSAIGGLVAWKIRHPMKLAGASVLATGSLLGASGGIFLQAGWLPIVAPMLSLVATGSSVLAYTAYKTQKEHLEIISKVKVQEDNIAILQTLLEEQTAIADDSTRIWNQNAQQQGEEPTSVDRPRNLLGGRYKIADVLGSGGFGRTYLAEDLQRPGNPECAIKHLKPARSDIRFLQVARRLFVTEAEILELLGKHPQIPQLLAYFEENQEFYLVEEFIQGHHLGEELPVDKRLPEAFVIEMLEGVLEVLAFIHEHQVIHRDIKPSNIIRRDRDGKLCLIDFGAVKQINPQYDPDTENFTVAIGTKGYAPPEQLVGQPRLSSDLYALGMIGIQALTGIAPHQLRQDPTTGSVIWRKLATSIQPEFANVIDKMVRYHFNDRYQTAAEVLQALKQIPTSAKVPSPVLNYHPSDPPT